MSFQNTVNLKLVLESDLRCKLSVCSDSAKQTTSMYKIPCSGQLIVNNVEKHIVVVADRMRDFE